MAELISKTYADALFEVALESDRIDSLRDELADVIRTFEENPMLAVLYKSPQINKVEKKEIIEKVFLGSVSEEMMNFLKILIDKLRADSVERIYRAYLERVESYKKETTAHVKTIVPMTASQIEQLEVQLRQVTGQKVTVSNVIDPDILGGVMIKIGDQVLDGSLKRRLDEMAETLLQVKM